MFAATDRVFSEFCRDCVAAGERCSLSRGRTGAQLEADIYSFIERVKYEPIPVFVPSGSSFLVDYTFVKLQLFGGLYYPQNWPSTADLLDLLTSGNTSAIANAFGSSSGGGGGGGGNGIDGDAALGIKCGDSFPDRSPCPRWRGCSRLATAVANWRAT